jgi:hypothetical protein
MKAILLLAALVLSGCTDAERGSLGAYGETAEISCFSGGKEVFKDSSTGKVSVLEGGGGWHYKSKLSGQYVRTYADCFVMVK